MKTFAEKILCISAVLIFILITWPSLASATACSHTCGPYSVSIGGYTYGDIDTAADYSVPSGDTCSSGWPSWGCDVLRDEAFGRISPTTLSASWQEGCGNTHSYSGSITGVPPSTVGTCGSATTTPSYTQPTINACGPVGGIPGNPTSTQVITQSTVVNNNWTWNWKCLGSISQTTIDDAICSAPREIDGQCGYVNGTNQGYPPENDFFTVPYQWWIDTYGSLTYYGYYVKCAPPPFLNDPPLINDPTVTTSTSTYTWTCQGRNGGAPASCYANKSLAGVCSSTDDQCLTGTPVASSTSSSWTCQGINGGANAACSPNGNGLCGIANGTQILSSDVFLNNHLSASSPYTLECTRGNSSGLSAQPDGTYRWSCSGVTSVAYYPGDSCGTAKVKCASGAYVDSPVLCGVYPYDTNGSRYYKCGDGTNKPSLGYNSTDCNTHGGTQCGVGATTQCSSINITNGACGPAATSYSTSSSAFSGSFCATGSVSPSSPAFPTASNPTTWVCTGSNGGINSPICTATKQSDVTANLRINNFRFNPSTTRTLCPAFWTTTLTGTNIDPSLVSCVFHSQPAASSSAGNYLVPPGLYTLSCNYNGIPSTAVSSVARCFPVADYNEH